MLCAFCGTACGQDEGDFVVLVGPDALLPVCCERHGRDLVRAQWTLGSVARLLTVGPTYEGMVDRTEQEDPERD